MIASPPPLNVESGAPAVIGKSAELVPPVSQALPAASSTTALNESKSDPPTNVENTSADPAALNLARKASPLLKVLSYAPGVVGKFADGVLPATKALPAPSTTKPAPPSKSLPPK